MILWEGSPSTVYFTENQQRPPYHRSENNMAAREFQGSFVGEVPTRNAGALSWNHNAYRPCALPAVKQRGPRRSTNTEIERYETQGHK
jgi:hypothetical protein